MRVHRRPLGRSMQFDLSKDEPLAKYRHRIFEMYECRDEAIRALIPNSAEMDEERLTEPPSSDFCHLTVARTSILTHVQFNRSVETVGDAVDDLRDDLARLAGMLDISSKVLLDFSGVESFSSACINELAAFDRKLRHRGSRMVLCSLAPETRACFFEAR